MGDTDGWKVEIVNPEGEVVFDRASTDEAEARTFASTVQQHIYWLSEEKFRSYYRLPSRRGVAVGFNAMQPGKVKKGDMIMLISAIVVIAGALIWALR